MPLLSRLTSAFPFWVLAACALALYQPTLFTWFSGGLITLGLGVIMLGMGVTLEVADFQRVLTRRRRVLTGVALQFTVMPAWAWCVAGLLDLPAPFAVGLILVGCCPGGTASNVIAFLARADVPLSVTMTAVSTLLATVLTPFLTAVWAGGRVEVPVLGLVVSTVNVVVLPVVAGLLLRRYLPGITRRILPVAPLVAVLMITVIVGSIVGAGRDQIFTSGATLVAAVIALHAGGFGFGYLLAWIVARDTMVARAISIEVGMQNSGLGIVLARQNFVNPLVAIPSALSSVFHSLIGSLLAAVWRRTGGAPAGLAEGAGAVADPGIALLQEER